jgi:hypothetical protein
MAIRTQRRSGGPRHVIPQSGWGWCSVALAAAFLVFAALVPLAIFSGLETSDFAPAVVIPMGLAAISAIAAIVLGIIGINSRNDRSILVYISVGLGPAALVVSFVGSFVASAAGYIVSLVR